MYAITTRVRRAAFVTGAAALTAMGVLVVNNQGDPAVFSINRADSGQETKFPTYSAHNVPAMQLGVTTSTTAPGSAGPALMAVPAKRSG
jgi:hypothetical protein